MRMLILYAYVLYNIVHRWSDGRTLIILSPHITLVALTLSSCCAHTPPAKRRAHEEGA